ncbi:MAG: mechanosensitive ion channel [Xanthomonadales bacterium]|nr:mechanosensitive ion channel [Xanthomonadales bacterium]
MEAIDNVVEQINWVPIAITWGSRVFFALLIWVVGLWLARRASRAMKRMLERMQMEAILAAFVGNLIQAAVLVLVLVTSLDMLGVPPTSLLAVMGAAGLAVGLAMKDSLSNIAAGVLLIVLRPFRAGDFVQIAGVSGVVVQVRLFQTTLRTPENHVVTLPNSLITAEPITNITANPTRRIDIPVGVDYGDDIRGAREKLLEIARAHDKVLDDPATDVVVGELADSSVNLVLRAWVKTPDYLVTRSDLVERVHRELAESGYTIPFPQNDTHITLPKSVLDLLERVAARQDDSQRNDAKQQGSSDAPTADPG